MRLKARDVQENIDDFPSPELSAVAAASVIVVVVIVVGPISKVFNRLRSQGPCKPDIILIYTDNASSAGCPWIGIARC